MRKNQLEPGPPLPVSVPFTVSGMVLLAIAACATPEGLLDQLEAVRRPADLEELDKTVREQFETLWEDLREMKEASHQVSELGTAWGELGKWFDVYRHPDSAARSYRNAERLDPSEPRWPYYLGRLAEDSGDLETARGHYTRAAELAPGEVAPRLRLADLALRQQELDRADAIYREILASHPEAPGALLGRGRLALVRGDPAAALGPLERLAELQPEAAPGHYSLGLAWRELGNEERAAEHFGRVPQENLDQISVTVDDPWDRELQLVDQGARTLTQRGMRAFRRGEKEQAALLLGRAVTADPAGAEKRINYAIALRQAGHWAAAKEELEEALALSREPSEAAAKARLELGSLLAARGRPTSAIRQLEAALAIDPRSVPAHLELGRLYQRQEKLQKALIHYAAARNAETAVPSIRFWHAVVAIQLDRRRVALESLEEDLREVGEDRQLRLLLARLLATASEDELRDVRRGRQLLSATTSAPDVLFAETAAMVAAAEGRFTEAVAWQLAAVDAVAELGPRSAAHTARRRLVLYERSEPCRNPWELREVPILVPVEKP